VSDGDIRRPIVVLNCGLGPVVDAVPGVINPTFTRVALEMSITEPACVLILDGRLSSVDLAHGRVGPCGVQLEREDSRPVCVVDAVGGGDNEYWALVEECLSSKGFAPSFSSLSASTSLGPKEVAASGDLLGPRV